MRSFLKRRVQQGVVFQQQPQKVQLLQGEDRVALGRSPQDDADRAEEELRVQHIAELEGKAGKIVLRQDGPVPQRRALRPVGHEEGVAVARGAQLRRRDVRGAEDEGPDQQHPLHPVDPERIAVAVEEIARREEDRHDHAVDEDVVGIKLDVLPGGVVRVQNARLPEGRECKRQHEGEDEDQHERRGRFLQAAGKSVQPSVSHGPPPPV